MFNVPVRFQVQIFWVQISSEWTYDKVSKISMDYRVHRVSANNVPVSYNMYLWLTAMLGRSSIHFSNEGSCSSFLCYIVCICFIVCFSHDSHNVLNDAKF